MPSGNLSLGTFVLISVIKVAIAMVILLTIVAYTVWLERKLVGHIQNRWGPSRVGPFGLLQPLADGLKLFFKEDLTPPYVHKTLYLLAPILSLTLALTSIAVIPIGGWITVNGARIPLQITDVNVGCSSSSASLRMGVYGMALAGWSSNSKYSLLGGLRASAQMVSYEVALGLSLVGVLIMSGTLQPARDRGAQLGTWSWIPAGTSFGADSSSPSSFICGRVRRDQSHALRPARGGDRTGRRLSHRVQLDEVRHVLHGRVRQHDDGRLPGHAAVPGRLERAGLRAPVLQACCPCSGLRCGCVVSCFFTSGCAARCRASATTS